MQDALLALSSSLEHIQNDLRTLASEPAYMRVAHNPITIPEAEALVSQLATLVRHWMMRPASERRHRLDRRQVERRRSPAPVTETPDNGASA